MAPIQLDRPKEIRPLAYATWQGYKSELNRFMGYCRLYEGVEEPTLHHFLNEPLLLSFISFLRARGVQPTQLSDMVGHARRVALYLHATDSLSPTCSSLFQGHLKRLDNLSCQLRYNLQPMPKQTQGELEEAGRWMEPVQLLHCITKVHEAACKLLPQHNTSIELQSAISIMEACMCCCFFGFITAMRPSIIITLSLPGSCGCLWPNCQHKDKCLGNRLEWCPGTGASSSSNSSSEPKLRLVAPHHKTNPNAKQKPISFVLPPELQELFQFHVKVGLPLIRDALGVGGDDGHVFVWHSTGKPVSPQQVSQLWNRVVLPPCFHFGPQVARAAFCTLVRDDAVASGLPSNFTEDGAAMVMGNSILMWDEVYDRDYRQRLAQAAVDNLAAWRQRLLASTPSAFEPPVAGAAVAAVGVDAPLVTRGAQPTSVGHVAAAAAAASVIDLVSDTDPDSDSEGASASEPDWDSQTDTEQVSDWETDGETESESGSEQELSAAAEFMVVSESDDEFFDCMSE